MVRKKKGVRVTLYMPDALRERANAAKLNLSRILRDGVERELRAEGRGPTVDLQRVEGSIEIHISIPVDMLRDLAE